MKDWKRLKAATVQDNRFSSPFQLSVKPKNKKKLMITFKRPTMGEKITSIIEPEIKKKIEEIDSEKNIEPVKKEKKKEI